ncbi:MAG TPA: ROK family protein [Acidimicrobiales bacterium]
MAGEPFGIAPSPGGLCLAVDIGGTKLAAGLVDPVGKLERMAQVPTPVSPDPGVVWAALAGLVAPLAPAAVVCGVGCGGPMARGGDEVSPLNIPGWHGFPLRRRLGELTGLPTFVDNDAKALALAEGWVGAARGRPDYVAMVVSTGVGGGIVSGGALLDGRTGNAGHIGHVVVEPQGRPCACGGRGCLEAEASGSAIAATTGRDPREASPEVVARCGTLVGRAVASVASLLDVPLALVGGSVALGFGEPFFASARAELRARAGLDFAASAEIRPVGLGYEGPLIGAGAVGWRSWRHATPSSVPALAPGER